MFALYNCGNALSGILLKICLNLFALASEILLSARPAYCCARASICCCENA